ncbi:pre-mRNA-splicing factor 38A, putative [Plasmodium relictum]|uniref:Pre-mRNA-splicing factor 38 n=1 Tax=Plasmodium relictum TaxID=85471 RepID=A0A1J1H9B8_PLARL|nr:pre-mRNA-splicing factor 38A, putative [Plasmodium relictum]CRH00198.1 pre-mRNA-splicing factor 38A, putative [Plasmodium relictum]
MANRTDVTAIKIFGSNPQYLISNIIRSKIYESQYWKEKCFALTSESIIDQAINLKYVGGTYGGNRKPTRFLCLILKLLQIQPDKDIVYEYIKNEEFIYLRALGIFYLRLIGKSLEIYKNLEPILYDYRKIRIRLQDGTFQKIYMDEFVDNCLILNNFLDVDFPTLTKRQILEENDLLEKRNLEYYKELLNISSDNELLENEKDKEKKNLLQSDNQESDSNCSHTFNKICTDDENENENKTEKGKEKERYNRKELRKKEERRSKREKEKEKEKRRKIISKKKNNHTYYHGKKKKYSSGNQDSYSTSDSCEYFKKKEKYYSFKDSHKKKKEKKEKKEKILKVKKDEKKREKSKYLSLKKDKDIESYRESDTSYEKYIKKKENNKNVSIYDENKKEDMSIGQWNKIRKDLGMKPLK